MSVVGAVMVRDEESVISRCLLSMMPLCDFIVVLDTGSTDDTVAIAESTLRDFPHRVDRAEWQGYATTRTDLVRRAGEMGMDWILVMDAGATVRGRFRAPDADVADIELRHEGIVSRRAAFLRSGIAWRYEGGDTEAGELHECVAADQPFTRAKLAGVVMERHGAAGDRRPPLRDLDTLKRQRKLHPEDPIWVFYIAQTYKALERPRDAKEAYRECAAMLADPELEMVWYCMFQAALLEGTVAALGVAYGIRPIRAETPYAISLYYSNHGRYDLALPWAKIASELTEPIRDILFINRPVYQWAALYELSIALATTGDFPGAHAINDRLLAMPREMMPSKVRREIRNNARSYPRPKLSVAQS